MASIVITPAQLTQLTEGKVRAVPWVAAIRYNYRNLENGALRVVSVDLMKRDRRGHLFPASTYSRRSYWPSWCEAEGLKVAQMQAVTV